MESPASRPSLRSRASRRGTTARRSRRPIWALGCGAAGLALVATVAVTARGSASESVFATTVPAVTEVGDPLTVGTRITVRRAGSVDAVRFYRSPRSSGQQQGAVYSSATGAQLAQVTFPAGGSGWRSARLDTSLKVAAGTTLTVAVFLPDGAYGASRNP